ncbi:RQC-minor-1 family DNA-binding protein [Neobacillus sp. Marseille-QA0830]
MVSKKVKHVRYELNANGITSLPESEMKIILRGADDLIMSGGRAMLVKILAGSKDKKLLQLQLDRSPVYGAFRGIPQNEILAKVDWIILHDYLDIENDDRLPLLVFTEKGWELERETYAAELMDKLMDASDKAEYSFVETLKDRNRGMIMLLLDKIAQSGNQEFIPILRAWQLIEYQKVRRKIQEVMDRLENTEVH